MGKNFTEIKAAFGVWLDTDLIRLPDAVRGDIINTVQREFLRENETRFGEYTSVFQAIPQIRDYNVLDNWRSPISAWYVNVSTNDIKHLSYLSKAEFDGTYPESGVYGFPPLMGLGTYGGTASVGSPQNYTVYGSYIQLGSVPDAAYSVFINYFRLLPDLTDAAPTNEFTKHAWEYLFFQGLVKCCEFGIEDDRAVLWQNEADRVKVGLVLEEGRRHATARPVVRSEMP